MTTPLSCHWYRCHNDAEKNSVLDNLCAEGHTLERSVAVMTAQEQLVSNLTVQENIDLPCAWRAAPQALDTNVLDCLARGLRANLTLPKLLSLQGAKLTGHERRWLGIARALHNQSDWLVLEDDEKNPHPFEDERLLAIAQYFTALDHPAITLHWVSLRSPPSLPKGWQLNQSGDAP